MINFLLDGKKTFAEEKTSYNQRSSTLFRMGGEGEGQKGTPPLQQTGVKFRVCT